MYFLPSWIVRMLRCCWSKNRYQNELTHGPTTQSTGPMDHLLPPELPATSRDAAFFPVMPTLPPHCSMSHRLLPAPATASFSAAITSLLTRATTHCTDTTPSPSGPRHLPSSSSNLMPSPLSSTSIITAPPYAEQPIPDTFRHRRSVTTHRRRQPSSSSLHVLSRAIAISILAQPVPLPRHQLLPPVISSLA